MREWQRIGDAFVKRMKRCLAADGINGERPDCILLFGGTNDDWMEVPLGELQYGGWSEQDLRQFFPAYCCMLSEAVRNHPQARIAAIVNTDMKPAVTAGIREACAHYGVRCIELHGITKQNGHPNREGMRQIAEQVDAALGK